MDTLKTGSLSVTLTFNKQNGTSITISGPNADKNITGAISYSGSYQLKAYTDTGVDVTNQAT
jgi:hypothetical protein